uniref:Uncharacterized protein n=1 Tax=Aureoumbra lagunensis TaxID=44058 RepID=A0A6S8F3M2_9STRA
MFNSLISWKSKLQTLVTTSTHASELVALGIAADETVWLRKLLKEIGFSINPHYFIKNPTMAACSEQYDSDDELQPEDLEFIRSMPMLTDNQGTSFTANNPAHSTKSKAIDIRWFKLREYVQYGRIRIHHISGDSNVADVMTKPLANKFTQFRYLLGMDSHYRSSTKS